MRRPSKKTSNRKKRRNAHPINLTRESGQILSSLWKVNKAILSALDFEKLAEEVVNVVLKELNYLKIGYRISVLTLVDKRAKIVRRVSFSPTPEALEILRRAKVRFHDIKIPLTAKENLLVKVIKHQKVYVTHDLSDVFYPEKTREIWRQLQDLAGIKTSLVFPLIIRGDSIGAMIFSLSKTEKEVTNYEKGVLGGFTDAVAVALQNANLYRRLQEANRRLKELDKMKDEFVSVASHELRTPMTSIKNYVWMVLHGKGGKITKKQRFYLGRAQVSTERLIHLVEDMLTISRIEGGRLETKPIQGDVTDLAASVIIELKEEADEKKIKFSLKSPKKKLPPVMLDKERIRQVLFNLIGNALKFTESGGKITVSFEKKNSFVSTSVTDTGKGIAESDIPKLFKKFGRLDRSFVTVAKTGGTGLGLFICKQIIDLHKGKIGVRSKLGQGSTFYFDLKIAKRG